MKRFLITLMVVAACFLRMQAQEGLNVAPFFTETYISDPNVTLVTFSGSQLDSRGLTKYKSISVADDAVLADKIARAVGKDGSAAQSKEVKYKDGMLYFGFYSMGGKGKHRRYLLYLNRRPTGKEKTTLIYIEGDLDAASVKRMIKG